MAMCFRRIFKSYSTLSYSRLCNQHALADQSNIFLNNTTPIECYPDAVPKIPIVYNMNQPKIDISRLSSTDIIENEVSYTKALPYNDLLYDKLYLTSLLQNDIMNCVKECEGYKDNEVQREYGGSPLEKPDLSQLQRIHQKLCDDLPLIFEKVLGFNIYHENIVFENNISGVTTVGIKNYFTHITCLRLYAKIKYKSPKLNILKITSHIEDGTVRVRWRVEGDYGYAVAFLYKQKLPFKRTNESTSSDWYDGFSIFYVRGDGLIHKHVASKMIPDDAGEDTVVKNPLGMKMAFYVGLISRRAISSLSIEVQPAYLRKELLNSLQSEINQSHFLNSSM